MPLFGPPNIEKLKGRKNFVALFGRIFRKGPEAVWRSKEPRCSVCGITSDAFFKRMEERHRQGPLAHQQLVQITNLVAVCPKCRRAFCNDHLIPGNPHDFFDNPKCPSDKTPLDADWDEEPSEDKPWRIGPRPKPEGSDEEDGPPNLIDELKKKRDVEGLIKALGHAEGDVRCEAAKALGHLKDARAVEPLIAALKDEVEDVRQSAACALGQLKDARAVDALIAALRDEDGDVRRGAAWGLGWCEDARAVEPLIAALKDEDGQVRWRAAWGLGWCEDARAVEPLIAALNHEVGLVRVSAARALGQLKDTRAVEPLIAALKAAKDDAGDFGLAAAGALEAIGAEAQQALAEYRARET